MKYKYGQLIREKTFQRDRDFLEKRDLSEAQIEAIQDYIYKKLSKNTGVVSTVVAIGIVLLSSWEGIWEIIKVFLLNVI